jgi:hypothetical protein
MPEKVFVDDDVLLVLETRKVLTTFTTLKIKYERPNGTGGVWAAAIHPSINTQMRAMINFDVSGIWKVQAFIAKLNEKFHGMWVDVKVYDAIAPDSTSPPTTMVPTT